MKILNQVFFSFLEIIFLKGEKNEGQNILTLVPRTVSWNSKPQHRHKAVAASNGLCVFVTPYLGDLRAGQTVWGSQVLPALEDCEEGSAPPAPGEDRSRKALSEKHATWSTSTIPSSSFLPSFLTSFPFISFFFVLNDSCLKYAVKGKLTMKRCNLPGKGVRRKLNSCFWLKPLSLNSNSKRITVNCWV